MTLFRLLLRIKASPYVVGFAAETENIVDNAKNKLLKKNIDMIVANDVSANSSDNNQPDIGFNSEYNALHVFWRNNNATAEINGEKHFDVAKKSQLARQLITLIATQYKLNHSIQEPA